MADFSTSNAVSIALMTDRREFLAMAQRAAHAITPEDAEALVRIVSEVMEEREKERDSFFATLHRLQELRNMAASFITRLDGDIEALIDAGAEWGRATDQESVRQAQKAFRRTQEMN